MTRITALLFLSLFTAAPFACAGDAPGQQQPPYQQPQKPETGFCDGRYQGFFYGQPGAATLEIEQAGEHGEISVTAWWGGGMWRGQGICCQQAPWRASFELYFPGAAVHRGVINSNGNHAEMEGQIDFGPGFHFSRED